MRRVNIIKKIDNIYLVGVVHNIQCDNNSLENQIFKDYLQQKIKQFVPDIIVEEFSEEALEINRTKNTIAQDMAKQQNIEYIFCDPNSEQREKIGIPSRSKIKKELNINGPVYWNSTQDKQIKKEQIKYFPIREKYWIDEIKNKPFSKMIFICGRDHLKSFKILLKKYKYEVYILDFMKNYLESKKYSKKCIIKK